MFKVLGLSLPAVVVFVLSGAFAPTTQAQEDNTVRLPSGWLASRSNCFAGKMVTPRVYFSFGPPKENRWPVNLRRVGGFGPSSISGTVGPSVRIAIDGSMIYSGRIAFRAYDNAYLSPDLTASQLRRLTRAVALEFTADGTTYTYDISGMAAAASEVRRCVSSAAEDETRRKAAIDRLPGWVSLRAPAVNFIEKESLPELAPTEVFRVRPQKLHA